MRGFGPLFALAASLVGAAQAGETVVLSGGTITLDAEGHTAEALVAHDGGITFVGTLTEAQAKAPKARAIDLKGAFAYPGFVDSHTHLLGIGLREMTLDLAGAASLKALQDALVVRAAGHPEGPITGRGWIETHWPEKRFPTRADLDAVVAGRPVMTIVDGAVVFEAGE